MPPEQPLGKWLLTERIARRLGALFPWGGWSRDLTECGHSKVDGSLLSRYLRVQLSVCGLGWP